MYIPNCTQHARASEPRIARHRPSDRFLLQLQSGRARRDTRLARLRDQGTGTATGSAARVDVRTGHDRDARAAGACRWSRRRLDPALHRSRMGAGARTASIVMGLAWPGWIRLPISQIPLRARQTASTWGAVALGASFSVAVCPACTPALVVLLGIAAGLGSPLFSAAATSLRVGRAVPPVLGASAIGWLDGCARLRSLRQRVLEIAGGLGLILSGSTCSTPTSSFVPRLAT